MCVVFAKEGVDPCLDRNNDVRAEWKERLGLYSFTQFMQVCFYHFKTGAGPPEGHYFID